MTQLLMIFSLHCVGCEGDCFSCIETLSSIRTCNARDYLTEEALTPEQVKYVTSLCELD